MYCYIEDNFVEDGKISVSDLGLTRGYGVFDFARTYSGITFKLQEHINRFRSSAQQLKLTLKISDSDLKNIVVQLINKNNLPEATVKMILTGGKSSDGILPQEKSTLIVTALPLIPFPQGFYQNGVKVATFNYERFLPNCKSLNYIPAVLALFEAKKRGAFEVFYTNNSGEILEGTTCNFFYFKGDTLFTCASGILPGITREVILEIAKKHFRIEFKALHKDDSTIDEAFLTASNKEVMPIVKIDDFVIKDGSVGKKTRKIMDLFKAYTDRR